MEKKPKFNAGTRLQKNWRWNRKPLRVRVRKVTSERSGEGYRIAWQRWDFRSNAWRDWRSYLGFRPLADVIRDYRDYADEWRGQRD